MLNKIHSGNKNSRALILTHQIESIFHLEKVCGDISQYETDTTKIYPSYFILQNHQLSFFHWMKEIRRNITNINLLLIKYLITLIKKMVVIYLMIVLVTQ